MRSGRLPALDGFRGLAVLAVFVYHIAFFGGLEGRTFLDRLVLAVALRGWLGVDLFFVLSGFLITGILLDTRDQPGALGDFYLRRLRRIVPAYAVALGVQVLVLALRSEFATARLGWTGTWLTNILVAREGWTALPATMQHYWSLAVEEQFYLLWPLLALMVSRRSLMRISVLCIVVASVCRVLFAQWGDPIAGYVLLPARMDGLAVGALLAAAARGPGGMAGAARAARPWGLGGGVLVAALIAVRGRFDYGDPLVLAFGMSAAVIALGALLVHAVAAGTSGAPWRLLEARPLVAAARYSYAIYLWHQPVIVCLTNIGLTASALPRVGGSQLPGTLLLALVAGILTIAISIVSWRWVEAPILNARRAP
jgi:peptidoglycan/LPS O-acetylase OafA/YrhL